MRETIIRYWRGLTLSFIFLLTLFFSLWSPHESFIATPKYWWDEAFTVETARTFSETGRLDFTVAPNTPSDKAIALNANGFPMSIFRFWRGRNPSADLYDRLDISCRLANLFIS